MKNALATIAVALTLAACGNVANNASRSLSEGPLDADTKLELTFYTTVTPNPRTSVKLDRLGIESHDIEVLASINDCTREGQIDNAATVCENADYRISLLSTAVPTYKTAELLVKNDGSRVTFSCRNATQPHVLGATKLVCDPY